MGLITRKHHEEVVALYEQRLQELRAEMAWYRKTFFSNHGFHYPEEEKAIHAPAVPQVMVSEVERRKTFRVDRTEWTDNDASLFSEFWEAEREQKGHPFDESEYWYHREYGNSPPSMAWQV